MLGWRQRSGPVPGPRFDGQRRDRHRPGGDDLRLQRRRRAPSRRREGRGPREEPSLHRPEFGVGERPADGGGGDGTTPAGRRPDRHREPGPDVPGRGADRRRVRLPGRDRDGEDVAGARFHARPGPDARGGALRRRGVDAGRGRERDRHDDQRGVRGVQRDHGRRRRREST